MDTHERADGLVQAGPGVAAYRQVGVHTQGHGQAKLARTRRTVARNFPGRVGVLSFAQKALRGGPKHATDGP